jgi:alpha-amylase/alpha-mannosidase (GH57 family)
MQPAYLTIHGHFYQPPRENPWTEEIDREPTAEPYHDWNERINEECYRANAFARILSEDGRVVDILNNYAYLSFNFGPTLLSWIRAHAPDVYERIRQGDAAGYERTGHGNAIAQVYNHIILPLANRRDKVTQVRWGLADFRYHFRREAEAMWLAETAVDYETLEVLAEARMRYVILSPNQARRIRPLEQRAGPWLDVSGGNIDPSRAYLCQLPSGRSIAVFFYDGPLSHLTGYGDLLSNSQRLMSSLAAAADDRRPHPQLLHIAVDGETFGHHKKQAELTLIYAFTTEAYQRGFTVTNYAAYLDVAPPSWEVEITPNTAWSCAHGLGRWSQNCGCRADGPAQWHQRWRAPLRAALDHLRDQLATLYEREALALGLKDPWQARDAYGEVLSDRTPERTDAFLRAQTGHKQLSETERERTLTLLEMQRQAMLMYTSCGWFFSEISGLESVQVLKYAAHAIDLASSFEANGLTRELLADLGKAESNVAEYGTGAGVYQRLVLPATIGPEKVAASYAINALIKPFPVRHHRHAYQIEQVESHTRQLGDYRLISGYVTLVSDFTSARSNWMYAAVHLGGYNFAASVAQCDELAGCDELNVKFRAAVRVAKDQTEFIRALQSTVSQRLYGLGELPPSDRRRVLKHLEDEVLRGLSRSYEQIYAEHMGTISALLEAHMSVPPELRLAAEYTLSHRLQTGAARLAYNPDDKATAELAQVIDLARRHGLRLERGPAVQTLEQAVIEQVQALVAETPDSDERRLERYARINAFLAATERLGFDIRPPRAQAMYLEYLRKVMGQQKQLPAQVIRTPTVEAGLLLIKQLRISAQAVTVTGSPTDRERAHGE